MVGKGVEWGERGGVDGRYGGWDVDGGGGVVCVCVCASGRVGWGTV